MQGAFKTLLLSKRFPFVAIFAACVLSLPTVASPLVLDDLWHRAMLLHDDRWVPQTNSPFRLFEFLSGRPEDVRRLVDRGFLPWWASPDLRLSFFRPLSSLTHAVDYALWPSSPVLMHVHSIAWYLVVVGLACELYRRLVGPLSALAASIAMLFFALDANHGLPVGWLANRNALVAAAFGLGTLLLHDTGARRARAGGHPVFTAAALGLALCGGESAVSTVFFLASHAVFLDDRPRRERVRSLLPAVAVFVFWLVVYRVEGFGAVGSGAYADPWHAPAAFLENIVTHGPLLLGAELGGLMPDPYPILPTEGKVVFLVIALFAIAWAARVIGWMVSAGDTRLRRTASFFVVASVLSVLPGSVMLPSGRTILLAGFGMTALLGIVCAATLEQARWALAPWSARTRRVVTAYAAWAWVAHAILTVPFFFLNARQMVVVGKILRDLSAGVPDATSKNQRLVVLNAPDASFLYYVIGMRIEQGRTPPASLLLLAANRRDIRITRTGERTLVVQQTGGFFQSGTDLLFRRGGAPMPSGSKVELGDVSITIAHATEDGVPDEASFFFAKDLNTDYVFRKWEDKTLVPCALPSIGQTFTIAGRMPDLFQ